jgi:tRNA-specific 2-thiouridylase
VKPGEIVDQDGHVVGNQEGAHAYTVGQRKGLHLGVPADDGKPRFVLSVRPVSNTVVVGPKEALAVREIAGGRISWAGQPLEHADEPFRCEVQIRAHADPVPATAQVVPITDRTELQRADASEEMVVTPDEPLIGVAPGQTAVLYIDTRVVGQFTIDHTTSVTDREPVAEAAV